MTVQASRRVRAEMADERRALLDHGVYFLQEDGWRNPWSTSPLRPSYRGRPYPIGKQVGAYAHDSSLSAAMLAYQKLSVLQSATQRRIEAEGRVVARRALRRLRAAQKPLAVIEPQSSIPGVQRTVMELEKRCRLPIEEIRACFRQGRRSAGQQAVRDQVEDAVRAMVKYHRMVHPVFEDPGIYGRRQWKEARAVWREFVGSSVQAQNDRQIAFQAFGEVVDDDGLEGPMPVEHSYDDLAREREISETSGDGADRWLRDNDPVYEVPITRQSRPRRASRSQAKPQIVPVLAEALDVHPNAVRKIMSKRVSRTGVDMRGGFESEPITGQMTVDECIALAESEATSDPIECAQLQTSGTERELAGGLPPSIESAHVPA